MPEQVPTSFRLEKRDVERVRWLAEKLDRSASSVIRQLLREAARKEGMPGEEQ